MAKKSTKKASAIDAIIQPFQFQSTSTQTESKPIDMLINGEVKKVSHRIRTGKTKRERNAKVREVVKEVPVKKGKKK